MGRLADQRNGEAIYGTEAGPYRYEIELGVNHATQGRKDSTSLYLNVVDWPRDGKFTLFGVNNPVLSASLLATGETIEHETKVDASSGQNIITLDIPKDAPDEYVSVIKLVVSRGRVDGSGIHATGRWQGHPGYLQCHHS
jgi:alpha-L-fucosidase